MSVNNERESGAEVLPGGVTPVTGVTKLETETKNTNEIKIQNPENEQCPVCKEWGHPYFISRHNH